MGLSWKTALWCPLISLNLRDLDWKCRNVWENLTFSYLLERSQLEHERSSGLFSTMNKSVLWSEDLIEGIEMETRFS